MLLTAKKRPRDYHIMYITSQKGQCDQSDPQLQSSAQTFFRGMHDLIINGKP